MFSRSLFIKIDKLQINTLQDSIMISEYIETCICYIIKKMLTDNAYNVLDVRYNYSTYKIDQAFNIVEQISVTPKLMENLLTLSSVMNKHLGNVLQDFYHHQFMSGDKNTLNINSMLVNNDSLLLSCEIFPWSAHGG